MLHDRILDSLASAENDKYIYRAFGMVVGGAVLALFAARLAPKEEP